MLGLPGIPTTDVTRPPPTAGPRLRNFTFSSGSLDLLSSSFVGVVDLASLSPSSDVFLSEFATGFCGFPLPLFLVRSPVLLWAMSSAGMHSARTKTKIILNSVFIGNTPAGNRKADRESYRKQRVVVQVLSVRLGIRLSGTRVPGSHRCSASEAPYRRGKCGDAIQD